MIWICILHFPAHAYVPIRTYTCLYVPIRTYTYLYVPIRAEIATVGYRAQYLSGCRKNSVRYVHSLTSLLSLSIVDIITLSLLLTSLLSLYC